jgi:cyclophilin family peptidyl-prolyl cis-trans isomerase
MYYPLVRGLTTSIYTKTKYCIYPSIHPPPSSIGQHTVFGVVVEGMNVVKAIEAVGSSTGAPSKPVTIVACGQL